MKTLQEAVDFLDHKLSNVDRSYILGLIKKDGTKQAAIQLHHGFGTWVRNTLGLWHEPKSGDLKEAIWNGLTEERRNHFSKWWAKHQQAYEGRFMHADDASSVIIEALVDKLAGNLTPV